MSLGCAMCGNCCNPVTVDTSTADVFNTWWLYWQRGGTKGTRTKRKGISSVRFAAEHWTEITRDDETVTLRCDQYDPGTKMCMAHDDRPPVCTDYPWYGVDQRGDEAVRKLAMADRAQHIGRNCSFQLDIPPEDRPAGSRPLIPIRAL